MGAGRTLTWCREKHSLPHLVLNPKLLLLIIELKYNENNNIKEKERESKKVRERKGLGGLLFV